MTHAMLLEQLIRDRHVELARAAAGRHAFRREPRRYRRAAAVLGRNQRPSGSFELATRRRRSHDHRADVTGAPDGSVTGAPRGSLDAAA